MWLTAFRAGVEQLVAYMLQDNRRGAKWVQDCGASGEWDGYKLVFRWDLHDLDILSATPAAVDLADWLAELSPLILGS
ncbi:MAG: hypothetical protein WCP45_12840, partial [Verrucomicrobiota bacterium]